MSDLPRMLELHQLFPDRKILSVPETVYRALEEANLKNLLAPGDKVAITAGSRGIKNIDVIIKTVVSFVSLHGCQPFILSAMGSHGGGTISGQLEILSRLGITSERVGAPVLAAQNCRSLFDEDGQVYANELAFTCDRIIVVNRIKPHTSFHGDAESGLQKMLAVGLGGPTGASQIHSMGVETLATNIPKAAATIIRHLPVTLGLAILEDSYDQTMLIKAVYPEEFVKTEKALLDEARRAVPVIPFDNLDILVVDKIGKVFSGTGMDTNVIGRIRINGIPEPVSPRIKRIVSLDLAMEAKGNAYGIGLADFTTKRLVDTINFDEMHLNAITSTFINRSMIPMTLPDDLTAIRVAIKSLGHRDTEKIRMVRIKNTLNLEKMLISEPLALEVKNNSLLRLTSGPKQMNFDCDNNLKPF